MRCSRYITECSRVTNGDAVWHRETFMNITYLVKYIYLFLQATICSWLLSNMPSSEMGDWGIEVAVSFKTKQKQKTSNAKLLATLWVCESDYLNNTPQQVGCFWVCKATEGRTIHSLAESLTAQKIFQKIFLGDSQRSVANSLEAIIPPGLVDIFIHQHKALIFLLDV